VLLASLQGLLGKLALGQVARDLGEADQSSGRFPDRIDDHVRPEAGPVLAHAPAFTLEAPLFGRRAESQVRQSGPPILLRVEAREMLAEDLGLRVALEALRAAVPAGHDPAGIEHVDGIIGDRLDEEAVAALVGRGSVQLVGWLHSSPPLPHALLGER
jgi:hypothetical protein